MLPTAPTNQHLINHERHDYTARAAAGRRGIVQPQTTATGAMYQVHILEPIFVQESE